MDENRTEIKSLDFNFTCFVLTTYKPCAVKDEVCSSLGCEVKARYIISKYEGVH